MHPAARFISALFNTYAIRSESRNMFIQIAPPANHSVDNHPGIKLSYRNKMLLLDQLVVDTRF